MLLGALSDCLDGEAPLAVRLIDIENAPEELKLPLSRDGKAYRRVLAMVRKDGHPLGWAALDVSPGNTVNLGQLAAPIMGVKRAKPKRSAKISLNGRGRAISVVITTCANPERVSGCLDAILACEDQSVEIIVVENRPILSRVERLLEDQYPGVRYVEEYSHGLSRARNAGLRVANGDLIIFTDDDIVVDSEWMRTIRVAFSESDVDCVTGLILPLELETPSQILVEMFASFGKGFEARSYSIAEPPPDQPLFPYTAGYFGSGANIAFRAEAIRRLGGFDPTLGAGTRARAGEDLDICIRLLHDGGRLAYEPGAIVWHRHPDTPARLREQVWGYGIGLGAMLFKQVVVGPKRWSFLSRAPQGIRYFTDPASRKNILRGSVFPRSLNQLERIGLLCGPLAYLTSNLTRR